MKTFVKKWSNREIWLNRGKKGVQTTCHMPTKLLSENKLIICAFGNIHYEISREKNLNLNRDSNSDLQNQDGLMVERQARDLEV